MQMDHVTVELSSAKNLIPNQKPHQRPWTASSILLRGTADLNKEPEVPRPLTADGGRGRQVLLQRDVSEKTRRRREKIARKILEEFDLEATIDKYRKLHAIDVPITGHSAVDFRFRQELMRIMGTEVIRLNDPEWNKKYHASIHQDYKKQLEEKEKRLVLLEKARLHRLRIEGLIEEEEEVGQVRPEKPKKKKSKKIKMTFSRPPKVLLLPIECTDDELHRRKEAADTRRMLLTYRPFVHLVTEIRKLCEEMAFEKQQHVQFMNEQQKEEERIRHGKQRSSSAFLLSTHEGEIESVEKLFDQKRHKESLVTSNSALRRLSARLSADPLAASIEQPQQPQQPRQPRQIKLLSKEERQLKTNYLLRKKTAKRLGKVLPPDLEEIYHEETKDGCYSPLPCFLFQTISGIYALAKRLLFTT